MSIEQEKESILKQIDSTIHQALQDGKAHKIEIEIKHSKLQSLTTYNRRTAHEWIDQDFDERNI